ncbi:DNA-processing protein DprA [Gordonia polyisoprenivorans]|uniref:DNA-processing protein DprA n=1 Tax=Gordonia polyisoprenivorans TaxID=84595 RepID=UPI002233F442|nr:DNA-processing protein DprA [Gordonia polyisoprenivorans]
MTTTESERRAWAYLARVAEPPCVPLTALVAEIGVLEAAAAIARGQVPRGHEAVLKATQARAGDDRSESDLAVAEKCGARLVTPDDDEWPGFSLLALANADTGERGGMPLALWARGPARLDDLAAASIALVGSRAASSYGEHVTGLLAEELVDHGWGIVSGAAFGIDGVAHRAALASGGATMAVLACGIDRDYPAAHSRLLAEIAERGVIVSEYPPHTTAARHRFLTRNRLVAALSNAVVVVEAGARSGAVSTAAWAVKLGRPLGAVPGPVTSATSVGCHELIADGRAALVADGAAVRTMAAPDGGGVADRGTPRSTDGLTPIQQRVHDALPGRGAVTVEEVVFSAGVEIGEVRAALAVLELGGLVAMEGSGWRLA